IEQFMQEGKSADKCLESLIQYFRDLLLVKMVPNADAITDRMIDPKQFSELANVYRTEDIFGIIDTLNHYHVEMKYSPQPQIIFEIALMKICAGSSGGTGMEGSQQAAAAVDHSAVEGLLRKVELLEKRIEQLASNAGAVGAAPS